jgi:uncharacterized membrane protein
VVRQSPREGAGGEIMRALFKEGIFPKSSVKKLVPTLCVLLVKIYNKNAPIHQEAIKGITAWRA